MLPVECLVHAAHSAELAAHGAGVVVLRGAVGPDGSGGLRVQGAGPLPLPAVSYTHLKYGLCNTRDEKRRIWPVG